MRGKACEHSHIIARYLAEISEYSLMSKEEEMALARDVSAGRKKPSSLNQLVQSNLSFVVNHHLIRYQRHFRDRRHQARCQERWQGP